MHALALLICSRCQGVFGVPPELLGSATIYCPLGCETPVPHRRPMAYSDRSTSSSAPVPGKDEAIRLLRLFRTGLEPGRLVEDLSVILDADVDEISEMLAHCAAPLTDPEIDEFLDHF